VLIITKEYSQEDIHNLTFNKYQYIIKRVFDYISSFTLLVITFPLWFIVKYKISKESPGKLLFFQTRVGINGKLFECIKFRTMSQNQKYTKNLYTQDDDPRIFPFGKFMRATRIDELPQLINVIKGDMHIIGPRAEWDILVNGYREQIQNYSIRNNIMPGITGLAQVRYPYGENLLDTKRKLVYDIFYIQKWSIKLEFKIIFETIGVIFGAKGK
jgi:lipopolysaccharide/colanic/teichoic acid biosynthesis glycosyltransferase